MSIPIDLLKLTESRAPGMVVYGGPGLKKTFAIHSCPYPILLHDFEGGTGPLIPWLRRRREWNGQWIQLTQADRLAAWEMLPAELKQLATIKPNPLIDIISYDSFVKDSYTHFIGQIGSFDESVYSTVAVDSLQEFSFEVQSFSKGGGELAYEPISGGTPMVWGPIQERTAIALRRLRDFRSKGVCIYLIGSEMIDKDFVNDPRGKPKGAAPEEAYSVKGTINLPGKMASTVPHLVDIMVHARALNGDAIFVTQQEPMPGGAAHWEAKDRFGRLDKFMKPNIREFFNKLYGVEQAGLIYKASLPKKEITANAPTQS